MLCLELLEIALQQFLVFAHQLWQVISYRHIQFLDRTTLEIGASLCKLFELPQRIQAEKVQIDFWIGQVVT